MEYQTDSHTDKDEKKNNITKNPSKKHGNVKACTE